MLRGKVPLQNFALRGRTCSGGGWEEKGPGHGENKAPGWGAGFRRGEEANPAARRGLKARKGETRVRGRHLAR